MKANKISKAKIANKTLHQLENNKLHKHKTGDKQGQLSKLDNNSTDSTTLVQGVDTQLHWWPKEVQVWVITALRGGWQTWNTVTLLRPGINTRLEWSSHKWTAETHCRSHLCLSFPSKMSTGPLVFRFLLHFCFCYMVKAPHAQLLHVAMFVSCRLTAS